MVDRAELQRIVELVELQDMVDGDELQHNYG